MINTEWWVPRDRSIHCARLKVNATGNSHFAGKNQGLHLDVTIQLFTAPLTFNAIALKMLYRCSVNGPGISCVERADSQGLESGRCLPGVLVGLQNRSYLLPLGLWQPLRIMGFADLASNLVDRFFSQNEPLDYNPLSVAVASIWTVCIYFPS